MSATTASLEVRAYLDAVRARLGDIPECDLEELLEDLEQHLIEVAAEGEGTLEDRLGPPAVYAEELRATAGFEIRDSSERRRLSTRALARLQRSMLGRALDAVAESKTTGALRAFRPGWWVLRGYLAVAAASIATHDSGWTNPAVPQVFGSYIVGLGAVALSIWLSVRLGRRADARPKIRRLSILLNVAVVILSVVALSNLADHAVVYQNEASYSGIIPPYLHHADGVPIANICPYASDGTPLTGVLLFDQEGRPIIDLSPQLADGRFVTEPNPAIRNAYPHTVTAPDPVTGQPLTLSCPIIPKQPQAPVAPKPSTK